MHYKKILFSLFVLIVLTFISTNSVLAIGDGSVLSNIGSNIGSGSVVSNIISQIGSNIGSGSSGSVAQNLLSNLGSGQAAQTVQTVLEEKLDYNALYDRLNTRLDTALQRLESASAVLETSENLEQETKEELLFVLEQTTKALEEYQTQVLATQTLPELQQVNEQAKAYLQENQEIIQESIAQAMIGVAKIAVENMDDFFTAVDVYLLSNVALQCTTTQGTQAYADLSKELDELEDALFVLANTVYIYGNEVEETQDGARFVNREDNIFLWAKTNGNVFVDTDFDGQAESTAQADGYVSLQDALHTYSLKTDISGKVILEDQDSGTVTITSNGTVEAPGAGRSALVQSEEGSVRRYASGLTVLTTAQGKVTVTSSQGNQIVVEKNKVDVTDLNNNRIQIENGKVIFTDVWSSTVDTANRVVTATDVIGNRIIVQNGQITIASADMETLISDLQTQMNSLKNIGTAVFKSAKDVNQFCVVE